MQNYASLQETHDQEEEGGVLFHVAEPTRSRWNHIEDLDSFFARMYKYHQRHGFLCMFLREVFELNQFVFVVSLTTYLVHGINYKILFDPPQNSKVTLNDVILPLSECISNFHPITWFVVTIAVAVWALKLLKGVYHMTYYWDIKQFYNTALGVEDKDLDNLTWNEIQTRIIRVQLEQQMCIHKRELTELDIYHRILRQENYLIAMVNKHLLPPRFNFPICGEIVYWSQCLRYNIQWLFFWSPWSPFENPWHIREEYRKQNLRHELAQQLSRQIMWLALANLVLAPIVLLWQILYAFFSYADMIKREPGKIGIRNWSLYARLYLRHFNELDHELHARLTRAYRPASKYLSAFSSPLGTLLAQQLGFICGALLAVLVALTLYDEDVITVEHVLTLMTSLGAAIAICRGLIPDETISWCPESLLEAVVMHTHYLPTDWQGQAHTSKIRNMFQQLFQYRIVGLLEELLSPLLTPYVLWYYVNPRSLDIVDFFRNFTVSVVGVGDVCSFAQLDIRKHGNPEWQEDAGTAGDNATDQYTQAEDGKVELSLMHFTTTNPSWLPPEEVRSFVENINSESNAYNARIANSAFQFEDHIMDSSMMLGFMPRRAANVWKSETPDLSGIRDMTTSAMLMHERHHMNSVRFSRSCEETTPLLTLRH